MTDASIFRRVISALDGAGIDYMLTGSFATTVYGTLRATRGIDFVIEANGIQLRALVQRWSLSGGNSPERQGC